jgi:hypothetical protein
VSETRVSESKHDRSWLLTGAILIGAVLVAMLMLMGFFNFLDSIGLPTGIISFFIVLLGVFSLSGSGGQTAVGSIFIMLVGLFLFLDSLGILSNDGIPWLWPVVIMILGLLFLIYSVRPPTTKPA